MGNYFLGIQYIIQTYCLCLSSFRLQKCQLLGYSTISNIQSITYKYLQTACRLRDPTWGRALLTLYAAFTHRKNRPNSTNLRNTVCPRSSISFYIVSYYIKRVTTSWTYTG